MLSSTSTGLDSVRPKSGDHPGSERVLCELSFAFAPERSDLATASACVVRSLVPLPHDLGPGYNSVIGRRVGPELTPGFSNESLSEGDLAVSDPNVM